MKRYGNLFNKIVHKQNILDAHKNARKGKVNYKAVRYVDRNTATCVNSIYEQLIQKTYTTSPYIIEQRIERGKSREIYKLPYYKDRIVHHAILQIVEPVLQKTYIKDTYQAIKGRGIHKAKKRIHDFLQDKNGTRYCLKIDIKKYYPNVDNQILKTLLRRKIKCQDTLYLLDDIVDSTKGLPIGNYTSQTLGNYYLSFFDHWIKEVKKIKYYVRYADDMVFFLDSKEQLHALQKEIANYLNKNLKLTMKENWQIFPTDTRGVDFLGFRFFHKYTLLRKSISKAYLKLIKSIQHKGVKIKKLHALMSYYGWIKSCDAYNLLRSTFKKDLVDLFDRFCSRIKIKNPLNKIVLAPKKNINRFGNYQPTLF
jgi:hypothetical protein